MRAAELSPAGSSEQLEIDCQTLECMDYWQARAKLLPHNRQAQRMAAIYLADAEKILGTKLDITA